MKSVSGVLAKAESLISPATGILELSKRPIKAFQSGGLPGVVNFYKNNFANWHAPTIGGFMKALSGNLGVHIINVLVGKGIEYAAGIAEIDVGKRIGRALRKSGEGGTIGALADVLIHPTAFNPHEGASHGGIDSGVASDVGEADRYGVLGAEGIRMR